MFQGDAKFSYRSLSAILVIDIIPIGHRVGGQVELVGKCQQGTNWGVDSGGKAVEDIEADYRYKPDLLLITVVLNFDQPFYSIIYGIISPPLGQISFSQCPL